MSLLDRLLGRETDEKGTEDCCCCGMEIEEVDADETN